MSAGHAATALSAKHALRLAEMPGPMHGLARSGFRFADATAAVYKAGGVKNFYTGILPNIMQVRPAVPPAPCQGQIVGEA